MTFIRYGLPLLIGMMGILQKSAAQDRIFIREGEPFMAKVIEIGVEEVRYKKSDFPDGPVFTLTREQIVRIVFENGFEESFVPRSPDVITLRSGEEIRAEIVEVNENNVIYRRDSVNHTLPKSEIAFITYINGTVEKLAGLNPVKKKKKK
ncbi:MAG: hypothetical protein SF052_07840 [Bacteroidia bacterium]|nr:hypothetical protein [Bacteroidia bacterium]